MTGAKDLSLLPRIYDAVTSDEFWEQALAAVAEIAGAKGVVLFAVDQTGQPFSIQNHNGLYTSGDIEYYFENLLQYDQDGWQPLQSEPACTLIIDQDLVPDLDRIAERPDYAWLKERVGVLRRGGARLNSSPGWSDTVTLQFPDQLDRISEEQRHRAQAVFPHLAKVVELHRSFAILRAHYHAVLTALDHVKVGVCVVSDRGEVVIANKEAGRIFSLGDGIGLGRNKHIVCSNPETAAALKVSIVEAVSTAQGESNIAEKLLTVERRSRAYPFLLEITPVRDAAGEVDRHLKGALLFIIDPDNPRPFSVPAVARCYKLTEAEADVCRLLVIGMTTQNIAAQRSVSNETVKSQIGSVFRKTGARSRAELIRLTLSITPPIERPDKQQEPR
ncbi:Bacterial regulatory protein, luxR family [Methyloligella halotolerans]|uniref:Bacterial regulatory protein, luxR family n=1 Tax=Methyloligella halotolerans TaxID=1177755 RepID=A0A1E2RUK9_9HYPH|nr:helix-turn-helix transcriptional regulator [Methyloligella halotolerans]ODA65937.1 Bacterial regulatory protein, luxR family [Methyloligella halotolerans]